MVAVAALERMPPGRKPAAHGSRTDRTLPSAPRRQKGRDTHQPHRHGGPDPSGRHAAFAGHRHPRRLRARTRLQGRRRRRREHRQLHGPENRHRRPLGVRQQQTPAGFGHAKTRRAAFRHTGRRPALLHLPFVDALPDGSLCRQQQGAHRAGPAQSERLLRGRSCAGGPPPFVRGHAPDPGGPRHDAGRTGPDDRRRRMARRRETLLAACRSLRELHAPHPVRTAGKALPEPAQHAGRLSVPLALLFRRHAGESGPGHRFPVPSLRPSPDERRFRVHAPQQRRSQEPSAQRPTLQGQGPPGEPVERTDLASGCRSRLRDRSLPDARHGRKVLHPDVRQAHRSELRPRDDSPRRRRRCDPRKVAERRERISETAPALSAR